MGKKIYPVNVKYETRRNKIPMVTFYQRVQRGWSIEKACSTPPKKHGRKYKKEKINESKIKELMFFNKDIDVFNQCPSDYNLIYNKEICTKDEASCAECWGSVKVN